MGVVYGCVTTGEDWQFLRLDGQAVIIDTTRRYINDVGSILAAFLSITGPAGSAEPVATDVTLNVNLRLRDDGRFHGS